MTRVNRLESLARKSRDKKFGVPPLRSFDFYD